MRQRERLVVLVILLACVVTCGCDERPASSSTDGDGTATNSMSKDYAQELKVLYEKARRAGEQVPEDVAEWAKADVKKIGTWDYKILSCSEEEILTELKKLGAQRWECYWVEPTENGKRFYMKKRVRSYLQMAGKVSKFVPTSGSGE